MKALHSGPISTFKGAHSELINAIDGAGGAQLGWSDKHVQP